MELLSTRNYLKILFMMILFSSATVYAQSNDGYDYERSSLCMMLVRNPAKEFNDEIEDVFSKMELPDRFNNHDLGVRLISFVSDKDIDKSTLSFAKKVGLGRRLVSKWFDRNKSTGIMDMNLIRLRGLYNSTKGASNIARSQLRGIDLVEDAGELLIGNTYLVMNDIVYVDKSVGWNVAKDVVNLATNLVPSEFGVGDGLKGHLLENSKLDGYNKMVDNLKSFKVKINSYLFRLNWNDDIAAQFYDRYYVDDDNYDKAKVDAFNNENSLFTLTYVGEVENTQSNTTLRGTTTAEQLIRKVCYRAIDKNLADLQHKFADFRIKAPLISVSPIKAYVGMKEDITDASRFEVLERSIDEAGHVKYKRVGVIKPIPSKIWDNRYWAVQEQTEYSGLDATYFTKVSGGDFYPGMLIREIK